MKKILGVSLVALMAVSTARADIASTAYVDAHDTSTLTSAQGYTDNKIGTIPNNPSTNAPYADVVTYVGAVAGDVAALGDLAALDEVAESNLATELAGKINGKADAASITGAQKTKITYNNQGIVTAGDDLAITDIPSGLVVGTAPISASRDSSTGVVTVSAAAATDAAAGVIKIADATDIANNSTTTAVTPAQLATASDTTALAGRVSDIEAYSTAYQSGITSALVTQIGTNQSDIATLNGDVSTTGSVAKSIADAIDDLDLGNTYASAEQGAKADTAVQPTDITTGTTNGTIKVGDTPVSVYGLDSAAYTASTDYLPAVASSSTATDGTYVLTMKVSGNTQVLAWETITRNNP